MKIRKRKKKSFCTIFLKWQMLSNRFKLKLFSENKKWTFRSALELKWDLNMKSYSPMKSNVELAELAEHLCQENNSANKK